MAQKSGSKYKLLLFAAPVVVLLTWPAVRWAKKANTGDIKLSTAEASSFHSQEEVRQPAPPPAPADEPAVAPEDSGLNLHYKTKEEAEKERAAAEAERAAAAEAARRQAESRAEQSKAPYAQSAEEKDFLRRNGGDLRKYGNFLAGLGAKHGNTEVDKMSAEFNGMPRLSALNAQYKKDKDPYRWARGAAALPEVRAALVRYSSNPRVVGALARAGLDALKNPPPQSIYKETVRFFTTDAQLAPFVRELKDSAGNNVSKNLPKGVDLSPLNDLGLELAGQPNIPPPPSLKPPARGDGCVTGASVYRGLVVKAITSFAAANRSVMDPDDACFPPYRIAGGKENAYVQGVAKILTGWGYPARQLPWAGDVISVKRTSEFHEEYDILVSNNCARSFGADTCKPAGF
ncbi:MAG: hypothetical protein A3J79_14070 [Elusimicrobia bacterium RIFOXYB2_FULL_62_6]|nr:MAG: hypothetical protein A3J79_14070 [Elusimicrobia bacterium RIFOXYB2_FULL_62_6]